MKNRRIRIGTIVITSVLVFLLIVVGAAVIYSEVGETYVVGAGELPASNVSDVPPSVAEEAVELAKELFGNNKAKYDDFVSQLLATYLEAKDKDLVVVFNAGGWGWSSIERSHQWQSIYHGMEAALVDMGCKSLWLNYERTAHNLLGCLNEATAIVTDYSAKAQSLTRRVEFLVDNLPDLKVIIAGESEGAAMTGEAMKSLADNPQVYSIQTGPPFWHKNGKLERTLVLTDNGIVPDAFSNGDILAMIWGTIKSLFGLSQPEDASGYILYYVRAPGHDYQWQYPGVGTVITNFLKQNFEVK